MYNNKIYVSFSVHIVTNIDIWTRNAYSLVLYMVLNVGCVARQNIKLDPFILTMQYI